MVRLRTDLALVVALAAAATIDVTLAPAGVVALRLPAALALTLVLPGYALAAALLPREETRPLERTVLTIAISLVVTILAALALEASSVTLTNGPWMGVLGGLAIVGAAVAAWRGRARAIVLPRLAIRRAEIAALAAALVLLGGAAALGFTPLGAPKGTQGSTVLWLCDRPNGCRLGATKVEVGVISDELQTRSWVVRVAVAGQAQRRYGPLTLRPGASWSRVIDVGRGRPVVRALLARAAHPAEVFHQTVLRHDRTTAAP